MHDPAFNFGFNVPTAVTVNSDVFWDITVYSPLRTFRKNSLPSSGETKSINQKGNMQKAILALCLDYCSTRNIYYDLPKLYFSCWRSWLLFKPAILCRSVEFNIRIMCFFCDIFPRITWCCIPVLRNFLSCHRGNTSNENKTVFRCSLGSIYSCEGGGTIKMWSPLLVTINFGYDCYFFSLLLFVIETEIPWFWEKRIFW
jgi:hypothetical protein